MAQDQPSAHLRDSSTKADNGSRFKIPSLQLTLMTKGQIAEGFHTVSHMIAMGNPHRKTDPKVLETTLLPALYSGSLQFWAGVSKTAEATHIPIGISTQLTTDNVFGVKRLWIASLYVDPRYYVMMPAWAEAFASLQIFARNNQCDEINGMYTEGTMLSVAQKLGFKNATFLVKELDYEKA